MDSVKSQNRITCRLTCHILGTIGSLATACTEQDILISFTYPLFIRLIQIIDPLPLLSRVSTYASLAPLRQQYLESWQACRDTIWTNGPMVMDKSQKVGLDRRWLLRRLRGGLDID